MSTGTSFSPAALREVDRRWRRPWKDASPQAADRFLDAVHKTASMLQELPQAGTLCETPFPRLAELRRYPLTLPFGRWLIVYLARPEQILILRVLHGSQDFGKLFP